MAVYVFVGIAFIIGLLCASLYHRFRPGGRRRIPAGALGRLAAMVHQLEVRPRTELGAVMIEEIVAQLNCRAAVFFTRHDVELHVEAVQGLDEAQVDAIARRLENDPEFRAPLPQLRTFRIGDAGEYAAVTVGYGHQIGITAVAPAAAAGPYGRSLIEAASGQVLARLETIRLGEELRQAATLDAVTRVHNQRYFLELLELEFNRSLRYRRALALLLCGIDGFADLQEQEGHEVGDRILRQITGVSRDSLRYFDVIGRYDADTLAVLLPEANRDAAVKVAERLLAVVTHSREMSGKQAGLSIGVACVDDPNADFMALLEEARHAMNAARAAGGNRVAAGPSAGEAAPGQA